MHMLHDMVSLSPPGLGQHNVFAIYIQHGDVSVVNHSCILLNGTKVLNLWFRGLFKTERFAGKFKMCHSFTVSWSFG